MQNRYLNPMLAGMFDLSERHSGLCSAFAASGLDPTGSGSKGGIKHGTYKTADTFATVETDGYFDTYSTAFTTGDLMTVFSSAATDGGHRVYKVTSTSGDIALARISPQIVALPWYLDQTDLLAPTPAELVCPVAGRITLLRTIIQATVTTGGAITVEVDTVAVDGLTITIIDTEATGVRQSDAPTAAHASALVEAGDRIEIIPAAAFATAGRISGVLEIEATT